MNIIPTSGKDSLEILTHTVHQEPKATTIFAVRLICLLVSCLIITDDPPVRLEPILVELEREKEDLLIIGHASVIRCILAYLIGLPVSEIPAIEVARGDLMEVVPASYGVHSQAFHFWDGAGRSSEGGAPGGKDEKNFYENYAEDTKGKRTYNSATGTDTEG